MYSLQLFDVIAFSTSIFMVTTCSAVLLPPWYAAWSLGMFEFSRSQHRLIMHIVSIFFKTDKSNTGLRLSGGPFFFPGFGSGVNMPICIQDGGFPSFAVVLTISAMLLCTEAAVAAFNIYSIYLYQTYTVCVRHVIMHVLIPL